MSDNGETPKSGQNFVPVLVKSWTIFEFLLLSRSGLVCILDVFGHLGMGHKSNVPKPEVFGFRTLTVLSISRMDLCFLDLEVVFYLLNLVEKKIQQSR